MNKFKLKKGKNKLTDEEISKEMNFDKFMAGRSPVLKSGLSSAKLASIIGSSVVVIATVYYMIYGSTQITAVAASPFINPPVKTMDIPSATFVTNTNEDTVLTYSSGTQITVPSQAFVDAEGNDIKGDVLIQYREFHDPIEIMLSGIPMNYDSAGVSYQLESAGMLDISATQNDKPLFLKPGKELNVNMISHTNNEDDYNIYNLDTLHKKWQYISENTKKNNTCASLFGPKDEFAENTLKANQKAERQNKPLLPKRSSAERANFSIDFDKNEFPELAVFKDLKFEPSAEEKKYAPELSKKTWENVMVERSDDAEHYIITFSTEKESHSFRVIPVVDDKNYEATITDYQQRLLRYEMALATKRKNESAKNDSLYKINELYKGAAMRSNLNERFNNFIEGSYMETSKDLLAYRTFRISQLGIWNSDKPFPFAASYFQKPLEGQTVEFVNSGHERLLLKSVYVIKRYTNSIFLVDERQLDHFPLNKEWMDLLVGITLTNQVVYIKDPELRAVDTKGTKITVKMNTVGPEISRTDQLKTLLKI